MAINKHTAGTVGTVAGVNVTICTDTYTCCYCNRTENSSSYILGSSPSVNPASVFYVLSAVPLAYSATNVMPTNPAMACEPCVTAMRTCTKPSSGSISNPLNITALTSATTTF